MLYGFSLLLFILGLVTGIPAALRFLKMRKIKQNSATATGRVRSDDSALGWLMSSGLGRVSRPLIAFQTPDEKEQVFEVVDSNAFKARHYEQGESVTVIYDKNSPWEAYILKEWNFVTRDLWMAGSELLLAIALWSIGLILKMPI